MCLGVFVFYLFLIDLFYTMLKVFYNLTALIVHKAFARKKKNAEQDKLSWMLKHSKKNFILKNILKRKSAFTKILLVQESIKLHFLTTDYMATKITSRPYTCVRAAIYVHYLTILGVLCIRVLIKLKILLKKGAASFTISIKESWHKFYQYYFHFLNSIS